MSTLSTLIYYPRSLALYANGAFVGLSLTMNLVTIPSIKSSKDPLPVFLNTYIRGSRLAIPSILVTSASNAVCYYHTKNPRFLYASILIAAVIPYTMLFIAPINNQLFALEKDGNNYDRKRVDQLLIKWNKRQYVRTIASSASFLLTVLCVV
jgi:uncharacterized membrane protein